MADINSFNITLDQNEVRAVHEALGKMSGNDYSSTFIAGYGSEVYNLMQGLMNSFEDDE